MSTDDARIGEAIRVAAGAVSAPERLRRQLAAQRARQTARRRIAGAFAATAATVLAAVLALSQSGGEPGSPPPTIADAVAVALRQPALPAPARDPRAPSLLGVSSGGVAFPDYREGGMRWRPDGLLRARRGGRDIVVVSYTRGASARASYAIVAGPALPEAQAGYRVVRGGTRFAVEHRAGTTIVSWRRGGRTCVLASRAASAQALLRMAAWEPAPTAQRRY